MATVPLVLLNSSANSLNITGLPFKAPGYFGYTNNSMTTQWAMANFIGRLYLEGSLASTPGTNDWFTITMKEYSTPSPGTTRNDYITFGTNILWIRARIDRTYNSSLNLSNSGTISNILLNY